jgi:hypothetical protein
MSLILFALCPSPLFYSQNNVLIFAQILLTMTFHQFLSPTLHGAFGFTLPEPYKTFPDTDPINALCYSGESQ